MKLIGGLQPYSRSTPQQPGQALVNMKRGATIGGLNPMDPSRSGKTPGRNGRKARPQRVPRAMR